MNAILDAHALLWFFAGSSKLSAKALACIQDPGNTLFVSPATLWEISIKDALGKLTLPQPFEIERVRLGEESSVIRAEVEVVKMPGSRSHAASVWNAPGQENSIWHFTMDIPDRRAA